MSQLQASGLKEFPLVIKGDVQGSVEAIIASLDKLGTDEVRARIVHAGVGAITESDVSLAETSGAPIIGFNVRANKQARDAAEREGVEIRYYTIIYDLVDDVKAAMSGLLSPERRETFIGNAEILQVFDITKVGKVAGCRVTDGMVERGAGVRLIRDNVVIHEGTLKTLKRFKDEVDGSAGRPGMRHGLRQLPGHPRRRRHRVLPRRDGDQDAVGSGLRGGAATRRRHDDSMRTGSDPGRMAAGFDRCPVQPVPVCPSASFASASRCVTRCRTCCSAARSSIR